MFFCPVPGEIDFPPCLDQAQVILSTPFAGLNMLPCGLLGTLTCSFDPDAITVDGDEYCPVSEEQEKRRMESRPDEPRKQEPYVES